MLAWLTTVVNDPRTERVIMSLIVVNAVILGLETSKTVMASYGLLLEILDHIILAVFVVEIAARVIVHRVAFFRDPWSVFDFIVGAPGPANSGRPSSPPVNAGARYTT